MCAHFPTGSYSSTLYFCGYIVFKFNLYVMVHSVCLAVPDACHWQKGHVVHNCRIPFYELWLNGIPAHVLVHTVSLIHSSTDTGIYHCYWCCFEHWLLKFYPPWEVSVLSFLQQLFRIDFVELVSSSLLLHFLLENIGTWFINCHHQWQSWNLILSSPSFCFSVLPSRLTFSLNGPGWNLFPQFSI